MTTHSTDLERRGAGEPEERVPTPQDASVADPIPDPGVPANHERLVDVDPRANKRAERQVAALFGISALATVLFVVGYVAVPLDGGGLTELRTSNLWLGGALGTALLAIGVAAIHWSKKVMTSVEIVGERHTLASDNQARKEALAAFEAGTAESGFTRRHLIRNSMIGAMALLPLPAVVLLRDLGPLPEKKLFQTLWHEGVRVVIDQTWRPVRPEDVRLGTIVNCMPENFEELPEEGPERLQERAKSPVMLVRIEPDELRIAPGRENWQIDGIVAYSKICTHAGCPINLYEQLTHHLLCPCHQSTFDLGDNGKVVFGPASRSLPQLPIFVDDEGYIAARSEFPEPVGPTFWERPR
jgi:ubiquinol-cytochrome c reductase iron-sulfur subunit